MCLGKVPGSSYQYNQSGKYIDINKNDLSLDLQYSIMDLSFVNVSYFCSTAWWTLLPRLDHANTQFGSHWSSGDVSGMGCEIAGSGEKS